VWIAAIIVREQREGSEGGIRGRGTYQHILPRCDACGNDDAVDDLTSCPVACREKKNGGTVVTKLMRQKDNERLKDNESMKE
jgi:hypothetical protein